MATHNQTGIQATNATTMTISTVETKVDLSLRPDARDAHGKPEDISGFLFHPCRGKEQSRRGEGPAEQRRRPKDYRCARRQCGGHCARAAQRTNGKVLRFDRRKGGKPDKAVHEDRHRWTCDLPLVGSSERRIYLTGLML